jgi:hypothetical protein
MLMKKKISLSYFFRLLRGSFLLFLIAVFLSKPLQLIASEQASAAPKSDSLKQKINLFDSDELLEVSLRFDLTGFQKKSDKAGSFDGTMTFHPGQPDSLSVKVSVKHRGEYRYQTCSFPPIQLNFKKPVYAVADTGKIKKIKLVTHCKPGSQSDDYVLREYLVYKIFSLFSDTSFRVRLLKINYFDTRKKNKSIIQYGFLIEPLNLLASRTNNVVVKAENLNQRSIIPAVMDRAAIFNYMIANWDWSVPGQHNLAIVKSKIPALSVQGIVIPFDFDLCGIVNADYGTPAPEMGLSSSRDRKYAGICRERQTTEKELLYFRSKKEEIYSVINDFPLLSQRSKKDITVFLDTFFDNFEKQRDFDYLVDTILGSCKKL